MFTINMFTINMFTINMFTCKPHVIMTNGYNIIKYSFNYT